MSLRSSNIRDLPSALHLLAALDPDGEGVAPIYVGDDITDEHAFEALTGRGIVIFAGEPGYLEVANRTTAAAFQPDSIDAVERFLDMLAR